MAHEETAGCSAILASLLVINKFCLCTMLRVQEVCPTDEEELCSQVPIASQE